MTRAVAQSWTASTNYDEEQAWRNQIQFTKEKENRKEKAKSQRKKVEATWTTRATATKHTESKKESTMLSHLDNTIHLQKQRKKPDKGGWGASKWHAFGTWKTGSFLKNSRNHTYIHTYIYIYTHTHVHLRRTFAQTFIGDSITLWLVQDIFRSVFGFA